MQLKKILAEKGDRANVISISSDTSLKEASKVLCKHGIGAVLVIRPDSNPPEYVGILSERDILKSACADKDFKSIRAEEVMTEDMIIAKSDDDVEYVMQIMTQKHIRHLPVVEDSDVIGVLSIRDIVNSMLKQQNIQIRHLSDYVGTYGNNVF